VMSPRQTEEAESICLPVYHHVVGATLDCRLHGSWGMKPGPKKPQHRGRLRTGHHSPRLDNHESIDATLRQKELNCDVADLVITILDVHVHI
jgi:hypothetical protein